MVGSGAVSKLEYSCACRESGCLFAFASCKVDVADPAYAWQAPYRRLRFVTYLGTVLIENKSDAFIVHVGMYPSRKDLRFVSYVRTGMTFGEMRFLPNLSCDNADATTMLRC